MELYCPPLDRNVHYEVKYNDLTCQVLAPTANFRSSKTAPGQYYITTILKTVITTMPPTIPSVRALTHTSAAWYLQPFFQRAQQCQTRSASILSNLSDNPGAYNKRIRRGRGPSSGKGKTSGRGHKGQKQHGSVPVGFNGGQTPDIVVRGERGFENEYVYLPILKCYE